MKIFWNIYTTFGVSKICIQQRCIKLIKSVSNQEFGIVTTFVYIDHFYISVCVGWIRLHLIIIKMINLFINMLCWGKMCIDKLAKNMEFK